MTHCAFYPFVVAFNVVECLQKTGYFLLPLEELLGYPEVTKMFIYLDV